MTNKKAPVGAGAHGSIAAPSLSTAGEATQFLELLGKDPAQTWFRTLKPIPGKGSLPNVDRKGADLHGFDPAALGANNRAGSAIYFITGDADEATGTNKKTGEPSGAVDDKDVHACRAVFVEWDDKPIEWQVQAWQELKLPEPTAMVKSGGKSVHCYWRLDEPMAPEPWRVLQSRLIDYAGGDKACKNPSRLMRLPGFRYVDKTTGKLTANVAELIHQSTGCYSAAEIEACLPALPPPPAKAAKAAPAPLLQQLPARELQEIQNAVAVLPHRSPQTYEQFRNALCGCSAALAEAGVVAADAEAINLMAHLWEGGEGQAAQILGSTTTRKATSFWAIAREHGYNLKRSTPAPTPAAKQQDKPAATTPATSKATPAALAQASSKAELEADPSRAEVLKLGFTELLEQALVAIRAEDLDTEMELRAEIMGRFKRSDTQITAALFRLLTEQETGKPAGSTIKAEALDLDSIEGLDALLDGFIPANDLGLMYGAKGSGKTLAALAMAFAAIDGTGFLDHSKPAQQGPVLFIASDSGAPPLMAAMQDLGVADHTAIRGADRSFYVWAHSASQGMSSWCASINGCVELLQFVKAKGIKLVLIDSAKTICAKAGISYLDNDSIAALLTFIKEAICPHTSVMILSHDGTEKGSHSGAKVWAEVPSIVHNIQQIPDAPQERLWRVVKNRMGSLRDLRYQVGEDGGLEACAGVETIQDATAAVLQILSETWARGITSMSRTGLVQEIQQRFRLAPKTVDNTLQRMARSAKPEICRVPSKRGHYKLSPRLAAAVSPNNVSPKEEGQGKNPVSESDLVSTRGVGTGYSVGTQIESPTSTQYPGVRYSVNLSAGLESAPFLTREVEMDIGKPGLSELINPTTRQENEQRIREHGRSTDLTGWSDADVAELLQSLEHAAIRRRASGLLGQEVAA